MRHLTLWAALLSITLSAGNAWAYLENHDEYTLELKGYSKETIRVVEDQVARMEGRYPAEMHSGKKQMWYNFVNNNWIGPRQPFGSDVIRGENFGP